MSVKLRLPLLMSCVTAIALTYGPGVSAAETRYLNWNNKAAAPVAQPEAQTAPEAQSPFLTPPQPLNPSPTQGSPAEAGYYGIPASPYGRVGAMGPQSAMPESRQALPSAPVAYATMPTAPQPTRQPMPAPAVAVPQAEPYAEAYPDTYPVSQPAPSQMAAYAPPPPPAQAWTHIPQAAPMPRADRTAEAMTSSEPAPVHSAPAAPQGHNLNVTGGYTESGYQVPASSPYASRIASARASQSQAGPEAQATAPAMGTPLSDEATTAYIPSEAMTAAAEASEPRYYSLHRQYGLEPDRIPPPQPSQGALLVPSTLMEDGLSGDDDRDQERAGIGNGPNE